MQTFPVTESTLSAAHLGQFLRERYNMSASTQCKLFRTGMNHLYLVNDGADKYVFRVYTHNWRTRMDISEELKLLVHLKANDIFVSYPMPDNNSEFIQEMNAPEGIRYGVLFSFAEGKKIPKFTAETSYHIGIAMAKIHKATENFPCHRITYNTHTLLIDSLARTKAFFINPSEEITFLEQATAYLIKEYEKVNIKNVRQGAVHMDMWFDNMHITEENKITIFDFDFCGNGWLCHDISYFLFQLYSTNQVENEYRIKAESFFKGYESVTEITNEEKRILPFTCLAVMLFYLSMQCDRYDTWSNIFLNEDHLKRFIASLKRWIAFNNLAIC